MDATQETFNKLRFHGDEQVSEGLIDLAVNVRKGPLPSWLETALTDNSTINQYPKTGGCIQAICERHQVAPDMVLPTAGAAEAFTLIARAFNPKLAAVVHPQFTEPEAALRAAGIGPLRVVLEPPEFALEISKIPSQADLIELGNPTNPTSVLHPKLLINQLRKEDRIVVVDEVFMDSITDETDSVISPQMAGLLVIRSITKTFSIPGVRAGYVVGDPKLISKLKIQQPPWAVSTQSANALTACLSPEGQKWADEQKTQVRAELAYLVEAMGQLPIRPTGTPAAPFLLINTNVATAHEHLAKVGFAVRRCDTFPGLTDSWIRVAARDAQTTDQFIKKLSYVLELSARSQRNRSEENWPEMGPGKKGVADG